MAPYFFIAKMHMVSKTLGPLGRQASLDKAAMPELLMNSAWSKPGIFFLYFGEQGLVPFFGLPETLDVVDCSISPFGQIPLKTEKNHAPLNNSLLKNTNHTG
ncbi:MAG: hypothetical protein HZB23_14290 [Deltaproteobacteria bacterium]|nr:hypothetical protein [Deltaproteobacteria bacterium]